MDIFQFAQKYDQWTGNGTIWNAARQVQYASAELQENHFDGTFKNLFSSLVPQILYLFDRSSIYNFAGDGYLFYRDYTRMLFKAIQLRASLDRKEIQRSDPPNYIRMLENQIDREFITGLFPSVNQEDANVYKRNFIDWFIDVLEVGQVMINEDFIAGGNEKAITFLNSVYKRDFLWNFRPVSGTKNLFRSPDPTRYQNEGNFLKNFIKQNNIKAVIDLRGPREAERKAYCAPFMDTIPCKCILTDFNEPPGAPGKSGYVKKLIYNKPAVVATINALLETDGAILFHCASGKDRTGVMATLFQKIAGVSDEIILKDYTSSGHDAREDRIQDVLDYLNSVGVDNYLLEVGFSPEKIAQIRSKILS